MPGNHTFGLVDVISRNVLNGVVVVGGGEGYFSCYRVGLVLTEVDGTIVISSIIPVISDTQPIHLKPH